MLADAWPTSTAKAAPLDSTLEGLAGLYRRPGPPVVLCVDERILCGEPLVAPYTLATGAPAERARAAFKAIRAALQELEANGRTRSWRDDEDRHQAVEPASAVVAFSEVTRAGPDTADEPPWPEHANEPGARLDSWHLQRGFALLRSRSRTWPPLPANEALTIVAPGEILDERIRSLRTVSLVDASCLSLDAGCIAAHRVHEHAPHPEAVPVAVRGRYEARLLRSGDILISIGRLHDVKVALYRDVPTEAIAGDGVFILRSAKGPRDPVEAEATNEAARLLELFRMSDVLNQIRMLLSNHIEIPLQLPHLESLRLPEVDAHAKSPVRQPALKLALGEIATTSSDRLPGRLAALGLTLVGLHRSLMPSDLPEEYAILGRHEAHGVVPKTIHDDRPHVPAFRLLWSVAHAEPSRERLRCAVVAADTATAEAFNATFLARVPRLKIEAVPVQLGLGIPQRFAFFRDLHRFDAVFVVLQCNNPFASFGTEHFLRRLVAVLGARCFVVLDARTEPPVEAQAKLVRRVLVDEGPLQVQFWLPESRTLPALRNLCDSCGEAGPAVRRALRDVAAFAAKVGGHTGWSGVAPIAVMLAERVERDSSEQVSSATLAPVGAEAERRGRRDGGDGRWSSTAIRFGEDSPCFITFDGKLRDRILRAYRQFREPSRAFLVEGPTGSGKCLIARYFCVQRFGTPPLVVNAYGSSATMESVLFGHKAGAFTDAKEESPGYFGHAEKERRPLIINETNSLDKDVQLKLLEVLQSGSYTRLGDPKPLPFTQKIIFAANERLSDLAIGGRAGRSGTMRADFLQRLGLPFQLEPLWSRENPQARRTERERLIEYLLATHAERTCLVTPQLDADAAAFLTSEYPWPGNVREMDLAMERLVIEWNAEANWTPVDRALAMTMVDTNAEIARPPDTSGRADILGKLEEVDRLLGEGRTKGDAMESVFGASSRKNELKKLRPYAKLIADRAAELPQLAAWLRSATR